MKYLSLSLTVTTAIFVGLSCLSINTNAAIELGDICGTYDFRQCDEDDTGNYCGKKCIKGKLKRCNERLVCGLETRKAQLNSWELRCRGCLNNKECGRGMYCDLTDRLGSSFYSYSDVVDCQVLGLGKFVTKLTRNCRNDKFHPFHYVNNEDCDFVRFYPGTCKDNSADDNGSSCTKRSIEIDTNVMG